MKYTVVVTDSGAGDFMAQRFMPPTPLIAHRADRVYRCYKTEGGEDLAVNDLDGQPIAAMHNFDTLTAAEDWVNEDVRQRMAVLTAGGSPQ